MTTTEQIQIENPENSQNKTLKQKFKEMNIKNWIINKENRKKQIIYSSFLLLFIIVIIGQNVASYIIGTLIVNIAVSYVVLIKFADKETFLWDCYISIYVGLFLTFTVISLLPLDSAYNISKNNKLANSNNPQEIQNIQDQIHKEQHTFQTIFTIVYWSILIFSSIYSFQTYYHSHGHITFKAKFKATLKYLVIMAIAGVFLIGILYVFIQYVIKEDAYSVIYKYGLILSQVYGIVILVFLLGYGLAQFPSYMWYKSNNQLQLNMTIATTEKKFNQFRQAKAELYEACDLMQQLIDKIPTYSELSVYKDKIIQEIPNNDEIRDAFSGGSISKTKFEISQSEKNSHEKEQSLVLSLKALRDVTEDSVAQARAILIRKKLNYIVAYNVWHKHLDKFSSLTNKDQIMQLIEKKNQLKKSITKNSLSQTLLQKKMNSKDKKKLKKEQEKKDKKNKKQKKDDKKNKNKLQENFIEKGETIDINLDTQEESKQEIECTQQNKYLTFFYKSSAIISLIFSITILWTQVIIITDSNSDLMFLREIIQTLNKEIGIIIFFALFLLYIILCSYFTLFKLNLGSFYAAYPKHTHPISYIFSVQKQGSIIFAMCYVIMMTFGQLSSQESNTNFSSGFNTFFLPLKNSSVIGKYYDKVVSISISAIGLISFFGKATYLFYKYIKKQNYFDYSNISSTDLLKGNDILLQHFEQKQRKQKFKEMIEKNSQSINLNSSQSINTTNTTTNLNINTNTQKNINSQDIEMGKINSNSPQQKQNLEKNKKKPNKSFTRSITSLFSSKKQKDPLKNNKKSDLNQTEIGLKNTENLSTSQSNIDFNNKNIFNLSNIDNENYQEKNDNENIDEKEFQTRPREKAFSEFRMRSKPVSENHLTIANSLNQDKIAIDGNQDTILFKNLTKLQQLEE